MFDWRTAHSSAAIPEQRGALIKWQRWSGFVFSINRPAIRTSPPRGTGFQLADEVVKLGDGLWTWMS